MASVRATASNSAGSGTAVTVARPTGTTTGDVVVVYLHGNGQTTFTDNNGGTPFTKDSTVGDYKPNTSYGHTVSVFYRRIQASDPTSYAFTMGASGRWSAIAYTIQDPDPTTILDATPTLSNAESDGNSYAAPTITTNTPGSVHLPMACLDDGATTVTGFPATYSNTVSENDQPMGVAAKVITPAGATGAQTFTFSASSARIGVSIVVKAAPASQIKTLSSVAQANLKKVSSATIATVKKISGITNV